MARKTMTKEVTKTTVKLAKMVTDANGAPQAEQLPDEILIGNVSLEKAQKEVSKKFDFPVTVFGVEAETQVYQMSVEKFIELAELKTDDSEDEETETDTEQSA